MPTRPTPRPSSGHDEKQPGHRPTAVPEQGGIPTLAGASQVQRLHALQRAKGNQYVQRMLTGGQSAGTAASTPKTPALQARTAGADSVQRSWWDSITETASSAWNTVTDTASSAYETVSGAASSAYETVSGAASSAYETVSGAASSVYETVSGAVSGAASAVGEFFAPVGQAIQNGMTSPEDRWSDNDQAVIQGMVRPGVLTPYQAERIGPAVVNMGRIAYARFRPLLDNAGSNMEIAFICKALAAGRSIGEIEDFAETINGLSERWMLRNLNVVDTQVEDGETGTGLIQQFGNSCGPTAVQIVRAQADPIYALELRSGGPIDQAVDDAMTNPENAPNQMAADEQRQMLADHAAAGTGNAATDRSNPTGGAWVESDMNAHVGTTGVTYVTRIIGTQITHADAMATLQTQLTRGITMPIVVGGSLGDTAHYIVALQYHDNRIQLHDNWTGETFWRTVNDFNSANLQLPSNHTTLTAIDVPTEAP